MSTATRAPVEASKGKAEPARIPGLKSHGPAAIPDIPGFLCAAGNMAIQRSAAGAVGANAAAILGGANMSSGGCSCGGTCEECKKKPVQRKGEGDMAAVSSGFHSALNRSGSGTPLGPHSRGLMERNFNDKFDDVRVHDDSAAADAARHIHAHAFTMGRDIYFGQGRYEPHSNPGQKLLAHELTHVLQQRKGAVRPGMKSLNATAHDDVFEHEAEQAEARFGREEHTDPSSLPGYRRDAHGHADNSSPRSVQRKCACGGTCSKCSGGSGGTIPQEMNKAPLQRKSEGLGSFSAIRNAPGQQDLSDSSSLSDLRIQRKCACGGSCSKCSAAEEEMKAQPVQRKAETTYDSLLGKSPSLEKTGAGDTAGSRQEHRTEREGQNTQSQSGKATQASALGGGVNRAAPPVRKATSAIQRSASRAPANAATHARNDKFEREADSVADDVTQGRQVSAEKISELGTHRIQASSWELCNPFTDPDCGVSSTAGVIADQASGIASEVWDRAKALAAFVGGVLTYIDNLLTITIPPMHVCSPHSLQVALPEIGIDLPFLKGAIPIAEGVEIYGEAGLHLGFTPEIALQLGPCETHEIKIAIHPLSLGGSASGGFDLTIAAGLGGEARAGIYGEVGVKVLWPDPPILLQIPVVNLQAGLAGFVRGIIADHMSVDFSAAAGLSGFNFDFSRTDDVGFALDLGLAGFGALTVLGQNLCTLYWPLYKAHKDTVLSFAFGFGMDVGASSSPSLSIDVNAATFSGMDWGDLGIEFQRDMFKDDCPLCDFLYALGLMPSQRGGSWTGHPEPVWPDGPLSVYPRAPHIPSKAQCRGACGPDCKTCHHEKDHRACEETGDGCHVWWVYPNYEVCESHLGCRNHDACYDWCSTKGYGKGPGGIYLSPCHRLCDFECICDYNTPQCVGWIGGAPPYDLQMVFSDKPRMEPGCSGPCPKESKTPGAPPTMKLCLPDVTVIGRHSLFHKGFRHSTGDIVIFSTPLEIPYIPPPTLDVFVRGEISGSANAGVGPVTLEGLCLIYDPTSHAYSGTGSLHLKGDLGGVLNLTGIIGAKAGWGCLLNAIDLEVIRGEAGLSATGSAHIPLDLSATAKVSCRHGKLMLDVDTFFKACLDLRFKLDALLKVLLFKRFEVFNGKWNLLDRRWGHCWDIPIDVTRGEIGSAACGGRTAASALGLPAPSGPPAALSAPGAGAGSTPSAAPIAAPAPGLSHVELGSVDTLSIKGLISDLFKLATQSEVIHDKTHGGLPADPAADAGKENPCGDVKPDDECGSKKLPLTHVSFFPGPLGQGGRVKASPLSRCAGNTEGSEPDNRIYRDQFDCINAAGQKGSWVRAHLLHGKTSSSGSRNLHGPGDDIRNLIISDKSLNGNMSSGAERPALDRVYDHSEVLWYDSRVDSYVSGLDFFAQSITVDFGSFDTDTGTEGPRLGGGTFTLKKTPPNCPATPAGGGSLVVPPGVLGGATDECADPLNIPEFNVTVDGRTRTVKTKDAKHTRMARKTLDRILEVAKQAPNCSDPVLSQCEQEFCKAVERTDKKSFGGQIDSTTRVDDTYKQLLAEAWQNKKPPSSGEWTEFGSADDDVGFDMNSKAATTAYTVHTNVTTGGKLFTGTHLFPGEGD